MYTFKKRQKVLKILNLALNLNFNSRLAYSRLDMSVLETITVLVHLVI